MYFGVWTVDLGIIAINLSTIFIAMGVLFVAIIQKFRKPSTKLFQISLLIFIAGVLYHTLHAKWLQHLFPIYYSHSTEKISSINRLEGINTSTSPLQWDRKSWNKFSNLAISKVNLE